MHLNVSAEQLVKMIKIVGPTQVFSMMHQEMDHEVELKDHRTDPHGILMIVTWPERGKVVIAYRSQESLITAKHINQISRSMEANNCQRAILYTTKDDLPSSLYRMATENNIEIIDREDLLRLARQIDAENEAD